MIDLYGWVVFPNCNCVQTIHILMFMFMDTCLSWVY